MRTALKRGAFTTKRRGGAGLYNSARKFDFSLLESRVQVDHTCPLRTLRLRVAQRCVGGGGEESLLMGLAPG
jgi:hypothetical protein